MDCGYYRLSGENMRYYKLINDGYLVAVGTGAGGDEITKVDYNEMLEIIRNKPIAESGYDYRLRADTLEWELVEVPVIDEQPEEEATVEDYEEAIGRFGV